MTLAAHSLIASAVATKITNPVVGLPLVVISHFVVDKIPHWDLMTNKNRSREGIIFGTLLDVLAGFAVAIIYYFLLIHQSVNPAYFFICVAASQAPDLYEGPHRILNFYFPGSEGAYQIQKKIHDIWFDARLEAPWGIVTQAVTVALFLLWGLS